jgi:SHS2 domain-containing protein
MMMKKKEGYQELAHTADLALKVWAADLADLFVQAALGMYALMKIEPDSGPQLAREIHVHGDDAEDLLVGFLEELLYRTEMHGEVYHSFVLVFDGHSLKANLLGAPVGKPGKAIKAVTYHNLQIIEWAHGLQTVIVFDV